MMTTQLKSQRNNKWLMGAMVMAMVTIAMTSESAYGADCQYAAFSSGSQYQYGDLVSNAGGLYRCKVGGWCASTADWAYEPGVGLYWTEAWSLDSQCQNGSGSENDDEPGNNSGDSSDDNSDGSTGNNSGENSDSDNDQSNDSGSESENQNENEGSGNEPDNTEDTPLNAEMSWQLDNESSSLQFITVKKEHVAEVQHFTNMSGGVNDLGEVRFSIELASVDTAISIRDERLRNFLFETDILPELQLDGQTDIAQLTTMRVGDTLSLDFDAQLQLHGNYQALETKLIAIKLPGNRIQVSTAQPILIDSRQFALDGGIEYLRELASLSSIGNTVPVYLNLQLSPESGDLTRLSAEPTAPSDVDLVWAQESQKLAVSWNDNSNNESHFVVQHQIDNGFWVSSDRIAQSQTDYEVSVRASGDYQVRVFAVNNSRPSLLSETASISVQLNSQDEDDQQDGNGDSNDSSQGSYSYAADCAACHGSNGEGNGGIPALTDPGYTLASLSSVIADTMPFGDAASCTGNCASDIAQYILDNFVEEVQQPTAPAAVSSVIAVASAAQDRIGLSWTDNSASESGLRIYRKKDSAEWQLITTLGADATSYADLNVEVEHSYTYRVQAFNGVGDALAVTSNTINLEEVVSIPGTPSQVQVTRDLEALLITWSAPSGQVDSYLVERSVNSGNWSLVAELGANFRNYEDLAIVGGSNYAYRIKARNTAGTSNASATGNISLPENLAAQIGFETNCAGCHNPSGIGGDLLGDFIKLDWADQQYTQMLDKVLTMPATGCDEDCKEAAAQFVWSDVWGYSLESVEVTSTDRGFRTLRLLTPYEYRNAVYDLTGVRISDEDLPIPHFDDHFKYPTQAELGIVLTEEALEFMQLAEKISSQTNLSLLGCSSANCTSTEVASMAERVLRRQLSSSEISEYQSFEASHGSRDALASMLMSPYFLYRIELGEWNNDKAAYQLNDYEVASALSFQLYGTTPNTALLSKAARGQLSTAQAVETELQNMIANPRFGEHFVEFVRYYTKTYDEVDEKPTLSASIIQAMRDEQAAAVDYLLTQGTASISELFNPGYTFVNNALASHYGMASPNSSAMIKVATTDHRGGLLHQGILQVANSDFAATSLVKRGKMIREHMMCHSLGVPSGIDPDTINMPSNPITTRERWDIITGPEASEGQCWQCHRLMNEPGSALESFDQEGRYRTSEVAYNDPSVTLPIDVTGTLRDNTGLVDLSYYLDARGLSEELASMEKVRECFVDSYVRYTSGHEPDAMLAGDVDQMVESFVSSGNILDLAQNVIKAESFLYRLDR